LYLHNAVFRRSPERKTWLTFLSSTIMVTCDWIMMCYDDMSRTGKADMQVAYLVVSGELTE